MPVSNPIVLEKLRALVGASNVLTLPEYTLPYGFDGTAALKGVAGVVVLPSSTEEVAAIVRLAHSEGIPVVTRGSGTGLSGGSVPSEGCLVLCLVRMDKILAVDPANLTLRAQAGAITAAVDAAAQAHGLFYPPDPGSMKISTIGGNVAESPYLEIGQIATVYYFLFILVIIPGLGILENKMLEWTSNN